MLLSRIGAVATRIEQGSGNAIDGGCGAKKTTRINNGHQTPSTIPSCPTPPHIITPSIRSHVSQVVPIVSFRRTRAPCESMDPFAAALDMSDDDSAIGQDAVADQCASLAEEPLTPWPRTTQRKTQRRPLRSGAVATQGVHASEARALGGPSCSDTETDSQSSGKRPRTSTSKEPPSDVSDSTPKKPRKCPDSMKLTMVQQCAVHMVHCIFAHKLKTPKHMVNSKRAATVTHSKDPIAVAL